MQVRYFNDYQKYFNFINKYRNKRIKTFIVNMTKKKNIKVIYEFY